jgi:hypothetical protein
MQSGDHLEARTDDNTASILRRKDEPSLPVDVARDYYKLLESKQEVW